MSIKAQKQNKTMLVESYEVNIHPAETEIESLAIEGEQIELIEAMNLEGQKRLINKETKGINPFRRITKEETVVFKTLFPSETSLEEYSDGPVPIEVLRLAKKAKDVGIKDTQYLQVWHSEAGLVDPILVARKSSYGDPVYLIARWGTALAPFIELKEQAEALLIATTRIKLIEMSQRIKITLSNVPAYVKGKLAENEKCEPYVRL